MTPEQVVEALVDDIGDVYEESEIRAWLDIQDACVYDLPSDFQSAIWMLDFKRTARDVMRSLPCYEAGCGEIAEFLDYWKGLTLAERLAYMTSETNDDIPE